jgi:bacteriorhodopsin
MLYRMEASVATLRTSFTICYLILFGTALITFIESMRTNSVRARHILNLETAVSLTAGFVYGMFVDMTKKEQFSLDEVMQYRYIDWSITTPMLLLVLLLFLNFENPKPFHAGFYFIIVTLNYFMLWLGYQGERGKIRRDVANGLGFLAFGLMLAIIWVLFVQTNGKHQKIFFFVFALIWSMYGVAATLDTLTKNMMYNVLDIIAKVFFGLYLWMYYGGVALV